MFLIGFIQAKADSIIVLLCCVPYSQQSRIMTWTGKYGTMLVVQYVYGMWKLGVVNLVHR